MCGAAGDNQSLRLLPPPLHFLRPEARGPCFEDDELEEELLARVALGEEAESLDAS